jgi:CIC family chloride channel protein
MIAAATGAGLWIVLDETVLLNFKQQQVFDYHKIPFYILLDFRFYVGILHRYFKEQNTILVN